MEIVRPVRDEIKVKICTKCNQSKSVSMFSKNNVKQDNLMPSCKDCNRKYYVDNKEKIKERVANYYEKNKKEIINKQNEKLKLNENRQKYRDYQRTYQREYRRLNKKTLKKKPLSDRQKAMRRQNFIEWAIRNKDALRSYKRKRLSSSLLFQLRNRLSSRLRHILCGNTHKSKSTEKIIGCTMDFLFQYLGVDSLGNITDLHLDHICPCSQAQDQEELLKLQHYLNLRLIKASENLSKSDKRTPEAEEKCLQLLSREWINA